MNASLKIVEDYQELIFDENLIGGQDIIVEETKAS